ncbi:MAG: beta-ketoacyl-ACP synthase [Phycisphaerae bacterium]|nr:beta-ketoacyl-ACP synthase [Gemmatimonadaceae bacterium]
MKAACYLNALGVLSALGVGNAVTAGRIATGESGLHMSDVFSEGRIIPVGIAQGPLPSLDQYEVPLRSRNNQLALVAALQLQSDVAHAIARYGAARVAVVVGTSTSGIGESELALKHHAVTGELPSHYAFAQQELNAPAVFLSQFFGSRGPAFVHSSACSSGAKAMASAARLLRNGIADAVVTGGVDSLSAFTIAGFSALNLISSERTNPLSANRDGINIGEAAALFLMTLEPSAVRLAGWGESSDGHHFSAPDPTGRGASLAIQGALTSAGVAAGDIEYVNLHATGTRANDSMESAVMHAHFGGDVPVSGTKPLTGHTLGAAGALEAAVCWLTMQDENSSGVLPPHLWDNEPDASIPALQVVRPGDALSRPPRLTMSTSFAFGGANAALVFGRE